jgi:hypothetical protein
MKQPLYNFKIFNKNVEIIKSEMSKGSMLSGMGIYH